MSGIILFGIGGLAIAGLYCFLVISKYNEKIRKAGYIKAFLFFLFIGLVLGGILFAKNLANTKINEFTVQMEEQIRTKNSGNKLVRDGIDLNYIKDDSSQSNELMGQLRQLLPSNRELGIPIPGFIYNIVVDFAMNQFQKINIFKLGTEGSNPYADENNIISLASIMTGLGNGAVRFVNRTALVISCIFGILLIIYVISTLKTARSLSDL